MRCVVGLVALLAVIAQPCVLLAVDLYTEDFETDPTANWSMFTAAGAEASDSTANYFFDYSTVGVPQAPRSTGSSTRGMNLQTNINLSGLPSFQGMSTSPNGQDFSAHESYKLSFDWWNNSVGPFPGGGSGSTQLSTFGIGTAGTTDQWTGGTWDSIFFAGSTDGGTASDYRAYSNNNGVAAGAPWPETSGVYAAGNVAGVLNNTNAYYSGFGSKTAPPEQLALFPGQTGTTAAGTAMWAWHQVDIVKSATDVTWSVDGLLMATIPLAGAPDAGGPIALGGGNIFFGMADINSAPSNDVNRTSLLFTLIDNIKVSTIEAPTNTPDFNMNGVVDAADYTVWRDNFGLMGTATQMTGDANGDMNVDSTDYDLWKAAFGTMPGSGASAGALGVPEPSTLLLVVLGMVGIAASRNR